jgi:hypothetical protein
MGDGFNTVGAIDAGSRARDQAKPIRDGAGVPLDRDGALTGIALTGGFVASHGFAKRNACSALIGRSTLRLHVKQWCGKNYRFDNSPPLGTLHKSIDVAYAKYKMLLGDSL